VAAQPEASRVVFSSTELVKSSLDSYAFGIDIHAAELMIFVLTREKSSIDPEQRHYIPSFFHLHLGNNELKQS
jgi:hypothetical protein